MPVGQQRRIRTILQRLSSRSQKIGLQELGKKLEGNGAGLRLTLDGRF